MISSKNFVRVTLAALAISTSALASTDPARVAQMDREREGSLKQLVVEQFKKDLQVKCEDYEVSKYEITKLDSGSAHQEKVVGTPYDYEGQYLLMLKCHTGSTFAGAYIAVMKSAIYKASFYSKYNSQGGPAKMQDLKINFVKDIELK